MGTLSNKQQAGGHTARGGKAEGDTRENRWKYTAKPTHRTYLLKNKTTMSMDVKVTEIELRETKADEKKLFECAVCMSDIEDWDVFTLTACGHRSCTECLTQYLMSNLKDQRKYPLRCFHPKCPEQIDYLDIKRALAPEDIATYDKFTIRCAFDSTTNSRPFYCPLADCDAMMILEMEKHETSPDAKVLLLSRVCVRACMCTGPHVTAWSYNTFN